MINFPVGNLRTKLFITILLILLASYSILIYSTFSSVENFVGREVDQQLLENLKLVRATIRSRADITIYSLSQPASAQPVRQWLKEQNRPLLDDALHRWHEVLPFLDFITVVDTRQRVVSRLGSKPAAYEVMGFSDVLGKSFTSLEPVVSTELVPLDILQREGIEEFRKQPLKSGALTAVIVIPVRDRNGALLGGIVAGDVIYSDNRYLEKTSGLLSQGLFAGISQEGNLIASSASGMIEELPADILASIERGRTFHGSIRLNNREYHAISEPILNFGGELVGAVTVTMAPDRYHFIRRENEQNILVAISIGALLTFIIAYAAAKRLTDPLRELAVGVQQLEAGDLDQHVKVVTKDEIGMLAESFNRMVLALKERDATISRKTEAMLELNEQLEARVQDRTALIQEQTRLQEEILGSMAEGVVVVDDQDRILLFNQTAREIFGIDLEVLKGQPLAAVCQKGAFCTLRDKAAELLQSGGQTQITLETGGKFLKANLSTVQGATGNITGVVMSIRDVTIEEAIDRMKTEFISTVSHELKTPLTSMKGSLQYILGKGKWLTGAERELLEICQRNTDRLIRLITSILDISTIEAGGVKFVMTPQVPAELAVSAIEELRGLALSRNVSIINNVETDLPMILGDHDRLIQVVTNLLANAIKFSEPGKVVKVHARREEHQLVIAIVDSNRTIPETERGKLFKKFQQIDQGEGGRLGGSGLGLAISKEIVERHGGRIYHQPVYSGGNEFVITIPLYEEQA